MFDEKVILPEQLPVKEKERKITDCCCTIVGAAFALTMFIVACVLWNRSNPSIIQLISNKFTMLKQDLDTNPVLSMNTSI